MTRRLHKRLRPGLFGSALRRGMVAVGAIAFLFLTVAHASQHIDGVVQSATFAAQIATNDSPEPPLDRADVERMREINEIAPLVPLKQRALL